MSDAIFTNTATQITVSFVDAANVPYATNRAGQTTPVLCTTIFNASSSTFFGSASACNFADDYTLVITLGNGATVLPNDILTLLPTVITNKARNSAYATGSVIVQRPSIIPQPSLVIRANALLSVCQDFSFDASGSYGAAGRPMTFAYSVRPNVPNEALLSNYFAGLTKVGSVTKFTLASSLFSVNVTYSIVAKLTNFLNATVSALQTVTRRSYAIPQLLVQGDPLVKTYRGQGTYMRADTAVPLAGDPSCVVPYPEVDYAWSFDDSQQGGTFTLDNRTASRKTLFIPPATLTAGTIYYLKVTCSVAGHPELSNEATAVVSALYSAFSTVILAPAQISSADALTLDVTGSSDADDPNPLKPQSPFGPFLTYWTCAASSDGTTANAAPNDVCFTDTYGFMNPDPLDGLLHLPAATLSPGTYIFTAAISKEPLIDNYVLISGRSQTVTRTVIVTAPRDPPLLGGVGLNVDYATYYADPASFASAFLADLAVLLSVDASRLSTTLVTYSSSPLAGYAASLPALANASANATAATSTASLNGTASANATASNVTAAAFDATGRGTVVITFGVAARAADDTASGSLNTAVMTAFSGGALVQSYTITGTLVNAPVSVNKDMLLVALSPYSAFTSKVTPNVIIATPPVAVYDNADVSLSTTLLASTLNKKLISYNWVVINGLLDLDAYPALLSTRRNNSNLVIKAGALVMGQKYTLRVVVTSSESGLSGYDQLTFTVQDGAGTGTFTVSPTTGFAAETAFTLAASGWEDASQQAVEYEFRFTAPGTSYAVPLVSRSRTHTVDVIIPPVTDDVLGYSLVLTAYIVNFKGVKSSASQTISVLPPKFSDSTVTTVSNCSDYVALMAQYSLSCPFNLTGAPAFTQALINGPFRTAVGINDVAQLLTVAQSIAKINNAQAAIRAAQPVVLRPPGVNLTAAQAATELLNNVGIAASARQLALVLAALQDAIGGSYVTIEEIDQYGVVFREATSDSSSLYASSASAQTSILSLAMSSTGTGLSGLGAQSLLDSAGGIVASSAGDASTARAALLNASAVGNTTSSSSSASLVSQAANINGIMSSLATAGSSKLVDGQDPFGVASANLQIGAKVMADPAGAFGSPAAPGQAAGPVFTMPSGLVADGSRAPPPPPPPPLNATLNATSLNATSSVNVTASLNGTRRHLLEWHRKLQEHRDGSVSYRRRLLADSSAGSGAVTVTASTQNNNPYSFSNDTTGIASSVASFGLSSGGSAIKIAGLSAPITFTMPVAVSGSSCRKTAGGCKYWDDVNKVWSTDGVIQISSTDTLITCQTIHLTDFGASADDVLPAMNTVDPIGDADLFTKITLDNAVAIFVVGIILGLFALLNAIGYAKDVRDRARQRLEDKISFIDARLAPSKKGLELLKGVAKPEPALTSLKAALETPLKKPTLMEKYMEKLKTQHRIASIVMVTPDDAFTRPQRLMILMSVVMGTIAVSALFFGIDPSNMTQKLLIGIFTSLILFVPNEVFTQMFKVRNSWGPTFGQAGYCFISYKYMMSAGSDFEVITQI